MARLPPLPVEPALGRGRHRFLREFDEGAACAETMVGGCGFDGGECLSVSASECLALGGQFAGFGTICD